MVGETPEEQPEVSPEHPDDALMSDLEQAFEQETPEATEVMEDTQTEDSTEVSEEPAIEIGGKRYTAKEIESMRAASLRHSDYTKKTQDLARQRKQFEEEMNKSKELREAEAAELEQWRRIEQIIERDPSRLEQFKQLIRGAQAQQPASEQPVVPPEIQERLDQLEQAEASRKAQSEMKEVYRMLGTDKLDEMEEVSFLDFVKEKEERIGGELPLVDAAKMYFHDKLVERALTRRQEEAKKRAETKAKTKVTKSSKKPGSKKGKISSDADFLSDIERALGLGG